MKNINEARDYMNHISKTYTNGIEHAYLKIMTNGTDYVVSKNSDDYKYAISLGWYEAK